MIANALQAGVCQFAKLSSAFFAIALICSAVMIGLPNTGAAAEGIPENASKKKYGRGWECNLGYRKKNNLCTKISLPENSYATDSSYGRGWECSRGYLDTAGQCVFIFVPPNAFLQGNGWKCERGYRRLSNACAQIELPENSHLTGSSYGKGWECNRPYKERAGKCLMANK